MKIIFRESDENRIVIEQNSEFSIFQAQYKQAHDIFERIKKDKKTRNDNNIIAFCGDRGSGKTSCMESFRKQIRDNTDYYLLNTIDPSFFDDTHNILELVLGEMYNQLKQNRHNHPKKEYQNENLDYKTENLLMKFNDAMYYMKYLANSQNREKYYDSLEELNSLGAGLRLQDIISELFAEFLKYYNMKLMILSIDDLDLNIQGVYSMIEYIRKYFTNEHCIILISVKVDQLVDAIKIHLSNTQHVPINDSYMMAVKYVNKIMPAGNRVNMPELEDYCDSALEYINASDKHNIYHSVKEAITRTIFWKTGYLFYNSKGHSSWIIPRNLRSLRQLLHLLFTMPDREKNDKNKHHANQHLFKNYFYHVWTQQLDDSYRDKIKWILYNDNNLTFNKFVITQLASLLQCDSGKNNFEELLKPYNYSYNISLGEVMNVLEYVGRNETDIQLQRFLFFIRSLYSIKLYEAYDSITNADDVEKELFPEGDKESAEIYASDAMFDKTNVLQRLVNGLYFSYDPGEVLPPTRDGHNRDTLLIDGNIIEKILRKLSNNANEIDDKYKQEFRLVEYFILCTSRYAPIKTPKDPWTKKLDSPNPVHIANFNTNTKNLVFDVLAPFYNILNLKNTYNRFNALFMRKSDGVTLYEFSKQQDWTLLNTMLSTAGKCRNYKNNYHSFLSDAVIRNTEVLTAMSERLKAQRYSKNYSSETHKCLAEFYKSIINSSMRTYPQQPDEEAYTIQFNFLESFHNLLNNCEVSLFNSIVGISVSEPHISLEDMFKYPTYKQSTILDKLNKNLKNVYIQLNKSEWCKIFPADIDISREKIIEEMNSMMNK